MAKKPPAKNSTSPPGISGRAPAVGPLESEQIAVRILWFSRRKNGGNSGTMVGKSPTETIGFPTQNDQHLGWRLGKPTILRKHPNQWKRLSNNKSSLSNLISKISDFSDKYNLCQTVFMSRITIGSIKHLHSSWLFCFKFIKCLFVSQDFWRKMLMQSLENIPNSGDRKKTKKSHLKSPEM